MRHVRRDRARRRTARRRAPELISVNGASKSERLIRLAVGAGTRITLDSARELPLVEAAAAAAGVRLARTDPPAAPAYRPRRAVRASRTTAHRSGTPSSRTRPASRSTTPSSSGARPAEAAASSSSGARPSRAPDDGHRPVGGADRELRRPRRRAVRAWDGWVPQEIDVGGGWPSSLDPVGRRWRPAGDDRDPTTPPCTPARSRARSQRRSRAAGSRVPGRSWRPSRVAPSTPTPGLHLATVTNVKQQHDPQPHRWIETDTSEVFLFDTTLESSLFPVVAVERPDAPPRGGSTSRASLQLRPDRAGRRPARGRRRRHPRVPRDGRLPGGLRGQLQRASRPATVLVPGRQPSDQAARDGRRGARPRSRARAAGPSRHRYGWLMQIAEARAYRQWQPFRDGRYACSGGVADGTDSTIVVLEGDDGLDRRRRDGAARRVLRARVRGRRARRRGRAGCRSLGADPREPACAPAPPRHGHAGPAGRQVCARHGRLTTSPRRLAGVPLCDALGGRDGDDRRALPLGLSRTRPTRWPSARGATSRAGYRRIQVKVGADPWQDAERVHAVRAAVGCGRALLRRQRRLDDRPPRCVPAATRELEYARAAVHDARRVPRRARALPAPARARRVHRLARRCSPPTATAWPTA